jgi:hypothetical protein
MKITLNGWRGERIYVNEVGAPRGQSLGYFQFVEYEVARGNSYYDNHRRAKGDATMPETRIEWHGSEGMAAKVLDAVFGADTILYKSLSGNTWTEYTWRTLREYSEDTLSRKMIEKCATGVETIYVRKTTATEKAKAKAAREAQVFDLDI